LQDELPTEDRLRFCDNIQQQTDKLKRLIEHLLLLARLEKQQLLVKTTVDLTAIMQKVLADKAPQFQQRQIQCQLELPLHLLIEAESFWLEQALSNIIDNALDFTQVGKKILIRGEKQAIGYVLTIQNQGQHIPDYALAQLFNRYYSLPRPDTQRKSTGLGLTLVKEVMHLHQATVVISNVEEGVAVQLCFPVFIEKSL
jgi:two-component system sensor histidine kinase CreC